jgi:hypothetical protein
MSDQFYAYVAKNRCCGCITAVAYDNPDYPERVAEDVRSFISSGRTVERMTGPFMVGGYCPHGCKHNSIVQQHPEVSEPAARDQPRVETAAAERDDVKKFGITVFRMQDQAFACYQAQWDSNTRYITRADTSRKALRRILQWIANELDQESFNA